MLEALLDHIGPRAMTNTTRDQDHPRYRLKYLFIALLAFGALAVIIVAFGLGYKFRGRHFNSRYYTYLAEDSQLACDCVFQIRVTTSEHPVEHTDPKSRIAIYRTFKKEEDQRPFTIRDLVIERGDGAIICQYAVVESTTRGSLVTQATRAGVVSDMLIEHYVYVDLDIDHDGRPIDIRCTVEDDASACLVSKRFVAQHHFSR